MENESVNNTEVQTEEVKTEKKKSNKGLLITLIIICSLFLAGLISCLVILFVNPDFIFDLGKKNITITFDSDGGSKVEKITYKQGTFVQLPTPTKEGYDFDGWIIDKIANEDEYFKKGSLLSDYWTKFLDSDITLKAKWTQLLENETVMTINFDGKGGVISGNNSKTSQSTVKCKDNAYAVEGLPKATKEGYNFMAWADKNGTPILDGALLTCAETLDLYATYEKKEETKPTTQEKKYKCQTGYELKDTNKCVQTATAEQTCDSGWVLKNGKCYNPKSPNIAGTRTCKKEYYAGDYRTGTYIQENGSPAYCGYMELTSYIGQRDNCINNGGSLAPNNHCYRLLKMNNYDQTCASDEERLEAQVLGGGSIPGCYQYKTPGKKCPDGYSSTTTYGDCAKVIDATLE